MKQYFKFFLASMVGASIPIVSYHSLGLNRVEVSQPFLEEIPVVDVENWNYVQHPMNIQEVGFCKRRQNNNNQASIQNAQLSSTNTNNNQVVVQINENLNILQNQIDSQQNQIDELQGQAGTPGAPGKDGMPGKDGKDGISPSIEDIVESIPEGEQGPAGDSGPAGPQGLVGPAGPKGEAGKDGKVSEQFVYETILKVIESSESPLKGEKGTDGLKGADGKDGKDGEDGEDGFVDYTVLYNELDYDLLAKRLPPFWVKVVDPRGLYSSEAVPVCLGGLLKLHLTPADFGVEGGITPTSMQPTTSLLEPTNVGG